MGILIKYTGSSGIRIIEPYEWNAQNKYVQEVDLELAANLITYPIPGQFALVANQKLSKADEKRLEELIGEKVEIPVEVEVVVPAPTLADVEGLSAERQENLITAGVADVATLAGLDDAAAKALAKATGATRQEIAAWSRAARALIA